MRHPIVITRWGKTIDSSSVGRRIIGFVTYEVIAPYVSTKALREMAMKLK